MASQFATGAVHIFVSKIADHTPQYFGTCEAMPKDDRQPQYEVLMNDLTGTKVPLDLAWEGATSNISLVMTRWNQTLAAETFDNLPSPTNLPGQWRWDDVGSLMALEGFGLELWLVYTFGAVLANKAAYVGNAAGSLPPGRHYPHVLIWSPQTDETGTAPMKRHYMFYAWPKLDAVNKKLILYDFDFTGINANMIT